MLYQPTNKTSIRIDPSIIPSKISKGRGSSRSSLYVWSLSLVMISIGVVIATSIIFVPMIFEKLASLATVYYSQDYFSKDSNYVENNSLVTNPLASSTDGIADTANRWTIASTTKENTAIENSFLGQDEETKPIRESAEIPPRIPPTSTIFTETITTSPTTSNTYEITETTRTQFGSPDLSARIIETGVLDKLTGTFTATSSFKTSDRIAVRFEIKNLGGRETGTWYFNAVLPTFPSYIFSSESQQSLLPGARTEYTLGFDSVNLNTPREFVVNADPTNSINETDKTNNIVKIGIDNVTP